MQLIIILLIITILGMGFMLYFDQLLVHAKRSSDNNDKEKPDTDKTSSVATGNPTSTNGQSDIIPIEPALPSATIPPTVTSTDTTCEELKSTEECAKTNDLIKQQVELEKQKLVLAQQANQLQQEQNNLANQKVIDNLQNQANQGTTSSNEGSSSSNSKDESSQNENNFSPENKQSNLGDNSRFVLMQSDNGQIGVFQIISNEDNMSVSIMPQTIKPLKLFDSTADALQWITSHDDEN